ncbi:hypothetical protein [Mycobacterium deserti]|uniref:Lipoprotein n=1 Tax=Mycobacterium deserti TaxID=2978347 RepID=A0ABT2MKM5_9MYCO|nr:hypothetical protein [Mycobacterium deserti]MCT7661945.1 hypothetical protein [Mycobacterium deserti]
MRAICLIAALALALVGCSGERIVNTDEPRPTLSPTPTTPLPPPPPPRHLVNAFNYVAYPAGQAVYYFTTPSGRWSCAIVPRVKAGCQSADFPSAMGITGEPDFVLDPLGQEATPNAVIVERDADPRFVAMEQPEFSLDTANVLDFNKILAAAGFRCNVQESGVSCMSEATGKGFAFSAEGFLPQYTEVPAGAP